MNNDSYEKPIQYDPHDYFSRDQLAQPGIQYLVEGSLGDEVLIKLQLEIQKGLRRSEEYADINAKPSKALLSGLGALYGAVNERRRQLGDSPEWRHMDLQE